MGYYKAEDDIIREAEEAWEGRGFYAITWSDCGMDWTSDGPVWLEDFEDLNAELFAAYCDATETHLPCVEIRPGYAVYVTPMICRQEGDNYMHESTSTESMLAYDGPFDSLARDAFDDALRNCDEPTINRVSRGLPAVEYDEVTIVESWPEDMGFDEDDIACEDTLTDEIRAELDRIQREYHDFLDYHRDYYDNEIHA